MENVKINIRTKQYSKPQTSLLIRSMFIAGIAFILVAACSYGFAILFNNSAIDFSTGLAVCLSTLLASMIISMLWTVNMFKAGSWPLTIICYLLYIGTMSVAFGWIFSLGFSAELYWLPVVFAIAGGVFLIATLIAKLMSVNGIITMGKMIGAAAIAMSIVMVVFLILLIVALTTRNEGVALAGDALCSLIMLVMCLITFLYVIIDIWRIQKFSQFNQEQGIEETKIMPWLFGFHLLTDLINVVFIILIFILRFSRRS